MRRQTHKLLPVCSRSSISRCTHSPFRGREFVHRSLDDHRLTSSSLCAWPPCRGAGFGAQAAGSSLLTTPSAFVGYTIYQALLQNPPAPSCQFDDCFAAYSEAKYQQKQQLSIVFFPTMVHESNPRVLSKVGPKDCSTGVIGNVTVKRLPYSGSLTSMIVPPIGCAANTCVPHNKSHPVRKRVATDIKADSPATPWRTGGSDRRMWPVP